MFLDLREKFFATQMYLEAAAADAGEVGAFADAALVKLRRLLLKFAQFALLSAHVVAHAVHQGEARREVGGRHCGAGAAFFALLDEVAVVLHIGGAVALFFQFVHRGKQRGPAFPLRLDGVEYTAALSGGAALLFDDGFFLVLYNGDFAVHLAYFAGVFLFLFGGGKLFALGLLVFFERDSAARWAFSASSSRRATCAFISSTRPLFWLRPPLTVPPG